MELRSRMRSSRSLSGSLIVASWRRMYKVSSRRTLGCQRRITQRSMWQIMTYRASGTLPLIFVSSTCLLRASSNLCISVGRAIVASEFDASLLLASTFSLGRVLLTSWTRMSRAQYACASLDCGCVVAINNARLAKYIGVSLHQARGKIHLDQPS
jgi:hypothetical protein